MIDESVAGNETKAPEKENETENLDYVCEVPDDLDYGQEEINFLFANRPGREDELISEGMNSGAIGSAVYERNITVEEKLGVKLNLIPNDDDDVANDLKLDYQSNTGEYDLVADGTYKAIIPVIEGCYKDLNQTEYVDTTKHYWTQGYNDMVTFTADNKQFLVTGAAAISIFRYMYLTIYNKQMFTEYKLPDLYDTVRNGDWTLDEFFSMTKGLYSDNGDGNRDNKDIYGFASLWDANASSFMQACDIYIATRNEEGIFELSMYGDRLVNMYDKLYNWTQNESTYIWNFGNKYNDSVNIDFLNSQAYFTHADLGTQYLSAEFDVGMLPMPKYDKQQEEYAHVNWGNNIVLPSTIKNTEMVGQVLELMGYYSKTMVQQKYYDEVLKLRVSDAPDDRDMVELIYNTIVYDPGIAFCDGNTALWNLVYLPCFAVHNNSESIASYYKGNSRSAERWLANLFKEK